MASQQEEPFYRALPQELRSDFQDLSFTAKLQFATSGNGVLFDMRVQAPSKGDTSDLQRRFGNDRILYVDMPSLNKPPVYLKGRNLIGRFQEMAQTPQTFLGRRWFLLLVQGHKKRKKRDPQATAPGASRLVFVAIDDKYSLHDVVSYVVPYRENAGQAARKLYSRFELVVSGSTPAITFAPEDIEYNVDDKYANSDPADTRFLDPALRSQFKEPSRSNKEMSDGCCEMSFYTACKVAEALGLTDIPSAIQCRSWKQRNLVPCERSVTVHRSERQASWPAHQNCQDADQGQEEFTPRLPPRIAHLECAEGEFTSEGSYTSCRFPANLAGPGCAKLSYLRSHSRKCQE